MRVCVLISRASINVVTNTKGATATGVAQPHSSTLKLTSFSSSKVLSVPVLISLSLSFQIAIAITTVVHVCISAPSLTLSLSLSVCLRLSLCLFLLKPHFFMSSCPVFILLYIYLFGTTRLPLSHLHVSLFHVSVFLTLFVLLFPPPSFSPSLCFSFNVIPVFLTHCPFVFPLVSFSSSTPLLLMHPSFSTYVSLFCHAYLCLTLPVFLSLSLNLSLSRPHCVSSCLYLFKIRVLLFLCLPLSSPPCVSLLMPTR